MSLTEFILLAPISLFVIVNPFSTVPVFLAITVGESAAERTRSARLACIVATGIMLFFALAGQYVFSVLGITLPAFEIAGGILLFAIAFDMLRLPDVRARLTPEERDVATEKEDVAITPLAMPLLCGPGGITTVIILQSQAANLMQTLVVVGSVPLVYFACFLVLRLSARRADWLNPFALRILRRLMGLLFAAIAVQFIVNGIDALPFISALSGN